MPEANCNPVIPLSPFLEYRDHRFFFTSPETCLAEVNHSGFTSSDFVFVINDWYVPDHPPGVAAYTELFATGFENLRILCNSRDEQTILVERFGFPRKATLFCPRHCFHGLSAATRALEINPGTSNTYDAVLNARSKSYKNRWAASKVSKLAILDLLIETPEIPCQWHNREKLSLDSVAAVLQQSYTGLILSFIEGACLASLEYLLCGLPVVSTHSLGGRDGWYTAENCILVGPTAQAGKDNQFDRDELSNEVASAVSTWVSVLQNDEVDRQAIRRGALERNRAFTNRFLQEIVALSTGQTNKALADELAPGLIDGMRPYYQYGAYTAHA